jgi:hypothetical protein
VDLVNPKDPYGQISGGRLQLYARIKTAVRTTGGGTLLGINRDDQTETIIGDLVLDDNSKAGFAEANNAASMYCVLMTPLQYDYVERLLVRNACADPYSRHGRYFHKGWYLQGFRIRRI